jgi:glycosyltransferase involved in cell wall biosynthesis
MKRVLIFSLAYFPKHVGGAEVAIKEITQRIPDVEFHMVTNRFDSTLPRVEQIGNVLVHRIGITTINPTMADLKTFPLNLNKPLFQFLAAFKAQQLQWKYGYSMTWAMMAHSCGVPAALFKLCNPKVTFLLTLQEGDPPTYIEKKMRPVWPLFKRAFTSADIIQPLSTFLARWARAMGASKEIIIIPNAVDVAHFSQTYAPAMLDHARAQIGKKEGDVFLITTSRLVIKNAVDVVIQAMPLLPEHVHFVVYGTGPEEHSLRLLIEKLGLEKQVHMMGQIGHQDMPLMLQACDIFIRPSRSEGFGSSFAEAMVARVPVIATQEGGIADFLFDEKKNPGVASTGWAVDVDSPKDIARAVMDIIARPTRVETVVNTAYRMVVEKYDWNTIASDMREKVFDRLT